MHDPKMGRSTRFVDAHVHIKEIRGLEAVLAAGVGAVRDAGTKEGTGLGIVRGERQNRPVVISAGSALCKKGGYGSSFGTPVESAVEVKEEIARLKQAGAGTIKIMASGIVSLRERGRIAGKGFSADEVHSIVEEAARCGLTVMAHANGEEAIISCSEAGVRSIEHGFFMTVRALDVMAKHGTFWTPTVGALARAAETGGVAEEIKAYISELIHSHLEMINRAHGGGVPLAIGTDCVLPYPRYQDAYEAEMAYFVEAGLSRDAVEIIACDNGARLLGMKTEGQAASNM
jgi:imidazolonepropionase-like amidohydrolase